MNQQPRENAQVQKTVPDSVKYKIFPRNLTARADYVVPGNPTNSRPEAGVDNCYPGLEFDQRNLDQRFFPGLVFYYHRGDGARLIELALTDPQRTSGLAEEDTLNPPLYLWGMLARHLVQESQPSMLSFQGQSGMEVWRRVHDLLPGPVAIVFGPTPGLIANLSGELQAALTSAYGTAVKGEQLADQFRVVRGKDRKIAYAVFADQRSPYIDTYGVIDPHTYPPGDLTKTMCAPWMYDFRDCYCFYWSSNKPDIVKVMHEGEPQPYVNFLRRVEDRQGPPKPDVDYYWKIVDGKRIQRRALELTYENMVEGWWQKLPVVLNDTEDPNALASPGLRFSAAAEQLSADDIIIELTYLATVEHALTVEYLYAYYSINADRAGAIGDNISSRIAAAASQVFQIAVDEMRHLMWANLTLRLLGAPPSVGRAERIAEPPDRERNGRRPLSNVAIKYLDQPFALSPLNHATLDWFIHVEAPSKVINQGLDGMYVYILEALQMRRREIPTWDRVIPVIKLIIDEGEGHWERFERIKETLDGIPEERYLRALSNEPPNAEQTEYLRVCDAYYHILLRSIELSLSLGEVAQAQLVGAAVRMMKSLDEMAFVLARQGYLPRFALTKKPIRPARTGAPRLAATREFDLKVAGGVLASNTPMSELESIYGRLDRSLQALRETGTPEARLRVSRHRHSLAEHILEVDTIIMHDLQTRVGQG